MVSYQQVLSEYLESPLEMHERYSFEQIRPYMLQPGDDLGEMIAQHAKVELQPGMVYELRRPITICSMCYIIGNGAKIKIRGNYTEYINIEPRNHMCSIAGMWSVTITDVVFDRELPARGGLIVANTHFILHGCNFLGFLGSVVTANAGGVLRGCYFFACYKAVDHRGRLWLTVNESTFEKCVYAVVSAGRCRIKYNSSLSTFCFLHMSYTGKIVGNSIMSPYTFSEDPYVDLVCCQSGMVMPLSTVHIVPSSRLPYPEFRKNVLLRSTMFVGGRLGSFSPSRCSYSYSSLVVDEQSYRGLSVTCCFDQTCEMYKLLQCTEADEMDTDTSQQYACLCGDNHPWPQVRQMKVTAALRAPRSLVSCNWGEFSDDDD